MKRAFAPSTCIALVLLGCTPLPDQPTSRALYIDLRKSVELSEDTAWVVDRIQLEANLEGALRSVCQVDARTSEQLAEWLVASLDAVGGPARLQYLEVGDEAPGLGEALTLERVAALLALAEQRRASDCPFWLAPDPAFAGVEGDAGKTVFLLESQGFGAILIKGDDSALSGGGGARVLVGRGLSSEVTVALGAELGGSGTLDPGDAAGRLDTAIHAAVPLVVRFMNISRVFDLEVAPVARFDQGQEAFPPGIRASIGGGFTAMRKGAFMPYVLLWVGYEGQGLFSDDVVTHSLRIGTRVGFDWDPSTR